MRLSLIVFLYFPFVLAAQLTVTDDFFDGDFTTNPIWSGDNSEFQINSGELQLNNTSAGSNNTSYLSTPSTILNNASWNFYYRFEQNPSSSNYGRVYLVSDQSDLESSLNGYYVDFGQSSDKLRLMKQNGTSSNMIIESASGLLNTSIVEVRVQVTRDNIGNWELKADTGSIEDPLTSFGTALDASFSTSAYMGVLCQYTVTRASAFFFDDFNCSGQPNLDVTPPILDTVLVISANSILLQFNEALDPVASQQATNYNVNNGIGLPSSASLSGANSNEVILNFATSFTNQTSYQLSVTGISDTAGNATNLSSNFTVNDPPAFISTVKTLNNTFLTVLFSESVSTGFASNTANFNVSNGIGTPFSTNQISPNEVELNFSGSFLTGVDYELIAENIEDGFGNISSDTITFRLSTLNIFDDFSDGDFTTNPVWNGNQTDFEVDANKQLHLNATPATGSSYLSTASEIMDNAQWEFYLKMDFATSGSNYAQVYVASQDSILDQTANGYFISIGGSADEIALYKQTGNTSTPIIQSATKFVESDPVEVKIKLTRTASGFFMLFADTSLDGNYINLGSASDSTFPNSFYFGVKCNYTSTRSNLFWFDDFNLSGDPYKDTIAPEIAQIRVLANNLIEVVFTENITAISASILSNYSIDNAIGNPQNVQQISGNTVQLLLGNNLQNQTNYVLTVQGIEDASGNITNDSSPFSYFTASSGDVVINEIMADPSPVIGIPPNALPEVEYIELYNNTALNVDLENWTLRIGNTEKPLPAYTLLPDSFVIITKDVSATLFNNNLPVLGVDISSTALTNSGTSITLRSPTGEIISNVNYTNGWYNDANKDDGGWSLEQIDPANNCGGEENWTASLNSIGGTPGRTNSVLGINPDTTAPAFNRVAITGDSSIIVYFSENVGFLLADESNYNITPAIPLDLAVAAEPSLNAAELFFSEPILPNTLYSLTLNNYPTDCSGNLMKSDTLIFALPQIPEVGEILVNEVLFNPYPGGSDFVEIYNNSDKVFDLSKLRISNYDEFTETPENIGLISEESYLFLPHTYLALTNDPTYLQNNYQVLSKKALVETSESLPSMPDSEGSIAVSTSSLTVIDHFNYSDDLHLPFLEETEGVSLERLSFEKSAQENDNWQSAASTAGFATPGYKNSQYFKPQITGAFTLQPKVFSPNMDGYHDVLQIEYAFTTSNNIVSVYIFSGDGALINTLQKNVTVPLEGYFTWNGADANSALAQSGIYIIVLDYYNENGEAGQLKQTCVLSL